MPDNPNAEIVAIGTEILLGEITDTNSVYLARQLRDIGVNVFLHDDSWRQSDANCRCDIGGFGSRRSRHYNRRIGSHS